MIPWSRERAWDWTSMKSGFCYVTAQPGRKGLTIGS